MAGYIGTQAVSVNTTSATISDDLAVGDDATIAGDLDVDGTSNLDVIDVDGAANFAADVTIAAGADLVTATAGTSNFRAGVNAGDAIASGGNYNVCVGDEAGTGLTTGDYNTIVGYQAGTGVMVAGANTFVGSQAGKASTDGYDNTAIGYAALTANTKGGRCTAVGRNALITQNVTTAGNTNNTAVGYNAGQAVTTCTLNTLVGSLSGDAITTGVNNSCLGIASGGALTTGSYNVGVGDDALPTVTTGSRNISVGRYAGYGITTGGDNIILGWLAGYAGGGSNQLSGNANHLIGNYTNVAAAANTISTVIGHSVVGKGSNTAFIGGSGGAYQQNNSADWSTTSDRRLKKNIVDSTIGLAEINQLQVRNFEYRTEDEITELDGKIDKVDVQGVQLGVIAQEIQAVLPECVETTSQGVLSVSPDNIKWHLVKAVQELSAANTALAARITALEGA